MIAQPVVARSQRQAEPESSLGPGVSWRQKWPKLPRVESAS